jgi:DNA-binding CsgD family transcriptional regulator
MGALANDVLERQALALIGPIYDAAVDPDRWHEVLEQLVGVVGASVGSLFLQETRSAHPLEVCSYVGYEQPFIDQYLEHYGKISPWLPNATQLEAGLDQLGVGVIVVRENAEVIFQNRMAERLIRSADALRVRRNRLCAATASETRKLRDLIRSALNPQGSCSADATGVTTLSRTSDGLPLQLLVTPLGKQMTWPWGEQHSAVIFAVDPERPAGLRGPTLELLYGLTPAEARLAAAFCNVHGDLARAAEEMGITQGSARQYLKNVFAKTDTHRQPELIELLSGLPSSLISLNR